MFMFNECHIHSRDCTWLNVFSHSQSLLIKHLNTKRFLSVLVVFGKFFVFAKMSKISKTVLPYFGDSVAGWSSRMSQSRAHIEIFRDSLASQCPSRQNKATLFLKFLTFLQIQKTFQKQLKYSKIFLCLINKGWAWKKHI